jgi:hypothetical protein
MALVAVIAPSVGFCLRNRPDEGQPIALSVQPAVFILKHVSFQTELGRLSSLNASATAEHTKPPKEEALKEHNLSGCVRHSEFREELGMI